MTIKRHLENEIMEMWCVIDQFGKNNEVVINRWVNQFDYTFEMIIVEYNTLIMEYNRKYGKRFGMRSTK